MTRFVFSFVLICILVIFHSRSILTGVTRILDLNTDSGMSHVNQTTASEASAAPTTAKVEKVMGSYTSWVHPYGGNLKLASLLIVKEGGSRVEVKMIKMIT